MSDFPNDQPDEGYTKDVEALMTKHKPQPDRFADLARELGCNEDEAAFAAKLREVAKHKPVEKEGE
jgi:hypothetical protein